MNLIKICFLMIFIIKNYECHYGGANYEYSIKSTEHCILKKMLIQLIV